MKLMELYIYIYIYKSRGSSVGIVTHYGLNGSGMESRRGRTFPHMSCVPYSLVSNVYRVSFQDVHRPCRDVSHPSQSNIEIKEKVELYC